MMRRAFVAVLLFAITFVFSSQAARAAEALEATVTGVQGMVQVRSGEDQPWQKATVGMKVGEDAEFRTGLKSAVQFTIPPGQTVTIDRLGTMKLLEAAGGVDGDDNNYKTTLGMKYGRARYDIQEGSEAQYESKVTTPSATLSIRGTETGIEDGPFGFLAWSEENFVRITDNFKQNDYYFGPGGKVDDESESAGDKALDDSSVNGGGDDNALGGGDENLHINDPSGNLGNQAGGGNFAGFRQESNNNQTFQQEPQEDHSVFANITTTLAIFTVGIFDSGAVDGDVVKLFFNNTPLNEGADVVLGAEPQEFDLNLNVGTNRFTAEFVSPGTSGDLTGSITSPHFSEGDSIPSFNMPRNPQTGADETRTLIINREVAPDT